jgi:hypothetical protein
MAEAIIEQIAVWIKDALDGVQDPDGTITLRSIRPKIINWQELQLDHGDCIIEIASIENVAQTTVESKFKTAMFRLNGIITELPADTAADTVLFRMCETIRRTVLAGYSERPKFGGLSVLNISCPSIDFEPIEGGLAVIVNCKVEYSTDLFDGYPS